MKISAQVAMWLCVIFGLGCLYAAFRGFSALETLTDPQEREASLGYAWFYSFLFLVSALFGVLSWMMKEGKIRHPEE